MKRRERRAPERSPDALRTHCHRAPERAEPAAFNGFATGASKYLLQPGIYLLYSALNF
jgi:hypothetical protein